MTSPQTYEQPLVSVDVVPLWATADGTLHITLGRRLHEPYLGEPALPGVLMGRERSVEAAGRALRSKIGVEPGAVTLRDIGVFDSPRRDPRGPTMAVAKAGIGRPRDLAGSEHAVAVALEDLPTLPFDHDVIIASAVQALASLLWTDREVCAALLGPEFTTRAATAVQRQLEQATEADVKADASNMKRRLTALRWVEPTDRTALPEGATGRPSTVWEWV